MKPRFILTTSVLLYSPPPEIIIKICRLSLSSPINDKKENYIIEREEARPRQGLLNQIMALLVSREEESWVVIVYCLSDNCAHFTVQWEHTSLSCYKDSQAGYALWYLFDNETKITQSLSELKSF